MKKETIAKQYILIVGLIALTWVIFQQHVRTFPQYQDVTIWHSQDKSAMDFCSLPYVDCAVKSEELAVQQQIRLLTKNVADSTALRIAKCESNFQVDAKNSKSSATGLYQFTNATWEHYCDGDRLSSVDQIQCFDKLYPKHPTWWECQ